MLEDVAAQHFSVSTEKGRWQRAVFPVVLLVGVEHKALLLPDTVPWFMELPLVGSHVFVAAWYLAMARALSAGAPGTSRGNMLKVAALLECGLTVTYHAKECATVADLAAFRISQSEVANTAREARSRHVPRVRHEVQTDPWGRPWHAA